MHKSPTQPLCRYCGDPIRKHTITVYVKRERSENDRSYTGFSRHVYVDAPLKSKAECQKLTNYPVASVKWTRGQNSALGGYEPNPSRDHISSFTEWDGETYVDPFFCNGDHAQAIRLRHGQGRPSNPSQRRRPPGKGNSMNATAKITPAEPIVALAKAKPNYPGERSGIAYNLEVDGVVWAHVRRTSRGMHGYYYTFEQVGGQTIGRAYKSTYKSDPGWREVIVRSKGNKRYSRAGTDERPTDQRLIDEAKALIAEGLMRHPDVQASEVAERRKAMADSAAEREAEEAANFDCRARMALAQIFKGEPEGIDPEYVAPIVAAMKWAQAQ